QPPARSDGRLRRPHPLMTRGQFRGPGGPWRVVFDGQSHTNDPPPPTSYPPRLMSGRGIPWANVAINGTSWSMLLDGGTNAVEVEVAPASERLHPLAGYTTATILVMSGGQQDIFDGDTGEQVYADAAAYAEAARAAG